MKFLYYMFLPVFCLSCALNAQSKFEFGVNFYPNYSMAFIVNDGTAPSVVEEVFKDIEIGKSSWSAGVMGMYHLNTRWAFITGANYMNTGYSNKEKALIFANPDPELPHKSKFIYLKKYIEIPFLFRFSIFSKERMSIYLTGGASWWRVLKNTSVNKLTYNDGRVETTKTESQGFRFRKSNIGLSAGFGLKGSISEHLSVFIQPLTQYGLFGIAESAPLNRKLLNTGISMGLFIK